MARLNTLRREVEKLYKANNPEADVWIDWGYDNHVLVVAELTAKLARKHGANSEFAVAGALLHDIADAVMPRWRAEHAAESLAIADNLLQQTGFSKQETEYIIREIIKPHGCNPELPTVLDGQVMATADAMAHFVTDFYPLFCWRHYGPQDDYRTFKQWVVKKVEKDYAKKIFFDDARQEIRPNYEAVKLLFADKPVGVSDARN